MLFDTSDTLVIGIKTKAGLSFLPFTILYFFYPFVLCSLKRSKDIMKMMRKDTATSGNRMTLSASLHLVFGLPHKLKNG